MLLSKFMALLYLFYMDLSRQNEEFTVKSVKFLAFDSVGIGRGTDQYLIGIQGENIQGSPTHLQSRDAFAASRHAEEGISRPKVQGIPTEAQDSRISRLGNGVISGKLHTIVLPGVSVVYRKPRKGKAVAFAGFHWEK